MNYYKDFKRERFHDGQLQRVIDILKSNNKTSLFEKLIGVQPNSLGNYISGRNKKDFDVLLEFEKYNILIETKVDSPESCDNDLWQTNRIYNKYKSLWTKKSKLFIYLTYGLSEFYIKNNEDGEYKNGPHSINFKHVTCMQFQDFLDNAIKECNIQDPEIVEWNEWLKFELTKREENDKYIKYIDNILSEYKKTLHLTDYPINRLNLFLPEFTIPFYYNLCQEWNKLNDPTIGKACLYPVGRGYSATFDSVLNFSELWFCKSKMTCGGIITYGLYFEFNEDFNLHLKAEKDTQNLDAIKSFILQHSDKLKDGFNAQIEDYNQGAHVLFEWDLKILSCTTKENITNIKNLLTNALGILK